MGLPHANQAMAVMAWGVGVLQRGFPWGGAPGTPPASTAPQHDGSWLLKGGKKHLEDDPPNQPWLPFSQLRRESPINPHADLQLSFPLNLSCSKNGRLHHWTCQIGQEEGGEHSYLPHPRGNTDGLSVPSTSLGPTDATKDMGRSCSLVNAGLGICNLVEAGDLEPEGVAPLALVHIVPKGQNHLQQLLEAAALQHCLGAGTDG